MSKRLYLELSLHPAVPINYRVEPIPKTRKRNLCTSLDDLKIVARVFHPYNHWQKLCYVEFDYEDLDVIDYDVRYGLCSVTAPFQIKNVWSRAVTLFTLDEIYSSIYNQFDH